MMMCKLFFLLTQSALPGHVGGRVGRRWVGSGRAGWSDIFFCPLLWPAIFFGLEQLITNLNENWMIFPDLSVMENLAVALVTVHGVKKINVLENAER
jgi:hypothetical protein